MIVDTHVHVVSHDEEQYPLRPLGVAGSGWHDVIRISGDELLTMMGSAGVDSAVLVQAMSAYQDDNRYTAETARKNPSRFTSVGVVDVLQPDPIGRLEDWVHNFGVRGVRMSGLQNTGFLSPDDTRFQAPVARAHALGIPVVLFATSAQLPAVKKALEAAPAVPTVLDHCGFPIPEEGPATGRDEPLLALACFENLYLKVTTRTLAPIEAAGQDPQAWLARLADAFGTHRLMWGSDFPASHDRNYAEHVAFARRCIEGFDSAEQERFLSGTALEVWPELGPHSG
ncbi:MAG: amidohydrolase [Myxococcota bacterium]